jgi:hypothetical protein
MKAVTWNGKRDARVDTVRDPTIQEPSDVIVRVTSSGICGSDLHLYELLGPYLSEGDILGHEPMGIVEEVIVHATAPRRRRWCARRTRLASPRHRGITWTISAAPEAVARRTRGRDRACHVAHRAILALGGRRWLERRLLRSALQALAQERLGPRRK